MTLKQLRLSKGLTLKQASSDMGIHLSTLCKYEKGYTKLSEGVIEMLKKYYGVEEFDEINSRYISLTKEIKNLNEQIEKLTNKLKISQKKEKELEEENGKLIKKLNNIENSIKKNIVKAFKQGV